MTHIIHTTVSVSHDAPVSAGEGMIRVDSGPAAGVMSAILAMAAADVEIMNLNSQLAQQQTTVVGQTAAANASATASAASSRALATAFGAGQSALDGLINLGQQAATVRGNRSDNELMGPCEERLNHLEGLDQEYQRVQNQGLDVTQGAPGPQGNGRYITDVRNRLMRGEFRLGDTNARDAIEMMDPRTERPGFKAQLDQKISDGIKQLNTLHTRTQDRTTRYGWTGGMVQGFVNAGCGSGQAAFTAQEGSQQAAATLNSTAQQIATQSAEQERGNIDRYYNSVVSLLAALRAAENAYPQHG